ncbi:hypothetical protein POM88_029439 [Heracleum sosnowskyi]|uniref:Endonuclease/exonuclease/phosphatase domain-containing protein n=1 Tax=Heracleum sosnowskyi TaxID=360622 RepID=A0AAD8MH79_9APIA|nr:hypothetical protein POM88_029439 [Heracleum sosnowskyi]
MCCGNLLLKILKLLNQSKISRRVWTTLVKEAPKQKPSVELSKEITQYSEDQGTVVEESQLSNTLQIFKPVEDNFTNAFIAEERFEMREILSNQNSENGDSTLCNHIGNLQMGRARGRPKKKIRYYRNPFDLGLSKCKLIKGKGRFKDIQSSRFCPRQNCIWAQLQSISSGKLFNVVNVYAPQKPRLTRLLWHQLGEILGCVEDQPICLVGDFNCIREAEECANCTYRLRDSMDFNDFINNHNLFDPEIQNGAFTWFAIINDWSRNCLGDVDKKIKGLKDYIEAEEQKAAPEIMINPARKELEHLYELKTDTLRQKDRFQWNLKGHQNTKFFHKLVQRREFSNGNKGIQYNGSWLSEVSEVKDAFHDHFKHFFEMQDSKKTLSLGSLIDKRLNSVDG